MTFFLHQRMLLANIN